MDKYEIIDYINYRDLRGSPSCNYDDRIILESSKLEAKGWRKHKGVCCTELGDPVDCPCPTMCEMGLGARMHGFSSNDSVIGGKT
jgi:hypothetical protein